MFKPLSELGQPWFNFLFESDRTTTNGYTFLFTILVTIFFISSWWFILDKKQGQWRRLVAAFFSICFIAITFGEFAYIQGALFTVDEYPAVDFSNHMTMFGENSVPVLLGEDDKLYAILVVIPDAVSRSAQKYLVYIPRTEIKYLATVRMVPLYIIEKYDDLLKIQKQMNSGR